MTKLIRSDSYIFTADPMSAFDMEKIAIIKKTVSAMNKEAKTAYGYAVRRAEYYGEPIPKAPTRKRVRLMGRGPRKQAALNDYGRKRAYDAYLPQRYAVRFDVYIADVR
jgi:hypothetical protein